MYLYNKYNKMSVDTLGGQNIAEKIGTNFGKITKTASNSLLAILTVIGISTTNAQSAPNLFGGKLIAPSDMSTYDTSYPGNKKYVDKKIKKFQKTMKDPQKRKEFGRKIANTLSKFRDDTVELSKETYEKSKPYLSFLKETGTEIYYNFIKPSFKKAIKALEDKKNSLNPEDKQKVDNLIQKIKDFGNKSKEISINSLKSLDENLKEVIETFEKENKNDNNGIIKTLKYIEKGVGFMLNRINNKNNY